MRWLFTLLVPSMLLICGAAEAAGDVPPSRFTDPQRKAALLKALPAIEQTMADRQRELGWPGLSYTVIIDGEVVLARASGLRDVTPGSSVDADTVFRIASMTKSFTALAVLKLRDAGKLMLDDPVALHVPELRTWPLATADSGPITLRQLLSHTAGLPEDNAQGDRTLAMSQEAFSKWLSGGVPFASGTGSQFEYSNLGFLLLGRVVTAASGQPFQTYISQEILKPLGMNSTYWSPASVPAQRLALGYRKDGAGYAPEPMLEDGAGAAMGGLMTTPRDLARFVAMMLAAWPPRDEPENAPVLRRTLREMQSGQGYPELSAQRTTPGARLVAGAGSYGYGLEARIDCSWGREVRHSGGLPGFGSMMWWLPDHNVGVVVMANLTYASTGHLARAALVLLHDTGALKPRQPQASSALLRAGQSVAELVIDWQDGRALEIAAENLFLDTSMAERKAEISGLRAGMGACKAGALVAENALRGTQRVDCQNGWLEAQLTLAPTPPPGVQSLEVTRAKHSGAALQEAALAAAGAIAKSARDLRLAPKTVRTNIAATLEVARATYGSCTLGELLEGDGLTEARYRLDCERGTMEMKISANDMGLLSALALLPSKDSICTP